LNKPSVKDDLASRKGNSTIMCSYHDLTGGLKWLSPELQGIYVQCQQHGDVVMLAGLATGPTDNYELESFRLTTKKDEESHNLIAFNTGFPGQLSRIFNPFLTPIKHHLLPMPGAPSQLSGAEINK
jgi:3-dehydroquinate dehydratase type I